MPTYTTLIRRLASTALLAAVTSSSVFVASVYAQGAGGRSVTQGLAKKTIDNLYKCPVEVANQWLATSTGHL